MLRRSRLASGPGDRQQSVNVISLQTLRFYLPGLVFLVLFSVACGGNGNNRSGSRPTIVWVSPLVGHPVYLMQDEAFRWAAQDYQFEPVITGPGQIDAEAMVREIENAIVQRVDGIITVPFNWSAFEAVYRRAQEAGILIVNTGNDTPEDWRLAFIGTDNLAYGQRAAKVLAEKTGGRANICIMMSQLDVQNQVEQRQAFEEGIKAYPGMKVVTVEADRADMATAVQKFEELFRAYPQIDAVLMLEATGGAAAARVAREMGIGDRLTILAVDDIAETIDLISKGEIWATLAQNFYRMGYESAGFIMARLEGRPVTSKVDSGTVLVTKDNVDDYRDAMLDSIVRRNQTIGWKRLSLHSGIASAVVTQVQDWQ